MQNDFDYESIYYKVIDSNDFDEKEKKALTDAVFFAYKKLDDSVRNYRSLGANQPVSIYDIRKFIERFWNIPENTGRNNTKGMFFTLNQDLLIERYFNELNLFAPYVNQLKISQNEEFDEKAHSVSLVSDIEKTNPLSSSKFFYIKIHGSWNWYSSDGIKKLIIGRNKINQINEEPVLKEYFEIFKASLLQKNVRLFVIGYGFGDEHINEVIAESIKNKNLKLYILNPTIPEQFKNDLCNSRPYGEIVWGGLNRYYPFSLSRVFPDNRNAVEYKLICESFL